MPFRAPTQITQQTTLHDQIKQDIEREQERSAQAAFDRIVTEAVEFSRAQDVSAFEAADWVARKYNYEDFEAVLETVRTEVKY